MKILAIEACNKNFTALIPDGRGGGIEIDRKTQKKLSPLYKKLYESLIDEYSEIYANKLGVNKKVAQVYLRASLVPVVNLIIDRCVRLGIALNNGEDWSIAQLKSSIKLPINRVGELINMSGSSFELNQLLLIDLGKIIGVSVSEFETPIKRSEVKSYPVRNHSLGGVSFFYRLMSKWGKALSLLKGSGDRVLTFYMANSTNMLYRKGIYRSHLSKLDPLTNIGENQVDDNLRDILFNKISVKSSEIIYQIFDVSNALGAENIVKDFNHLLKKYFPVNMLESVPDLFTQADSMLRKYGNKPLLFSTFNLDMDIHYIASSKKTNRKCIDLQHGGYYGYMKHMDHTIELEVAFCDTFISWGWGVLPEIGSCNVIPLPSPWLSQRAVELNKFYAINKHKDYDLLLMTSKIYRFPLANMNAAGVLTDQARENWNRIKHLVHCAKKNDIRILHKPYNLDNYSRFKRELDELSTIGGGLYTINTELEKGLSKGLVSSCSIVVWDVPGTGFLECISSKIPTIVIWDRSFCEEVDEAKKLFQGLEDVGVIHRDPLLALQEVKSAKKNINLWMNDLNRKNAIRKFCQKYAWTDKNWPAYWRKYLNELLNKVDR